MRQNQIVIIRMSNLEQIVIEMSKLEGHDLNGQERLIIRTRLSALQAARARYRQRMEAPEYQWKKPESHRR